MARARHGLVNDIMKARVFGVSVLALCLAGCALETPPPSTGFMPRDAFGNQVIGQDLAMATFNEAFFAFSHWKMMQGRPADMAMAVASLDAMAGQFSTGGRWWAFDQIAKMQMLQARTRVRAILGISETAPSQEVIDQLVAASHALDAGDEAAALAALSGRVFTMPATQTLALLTHFPYVPIANYATITASNDLYPSGGGGNNTR
jgi:hypothetical protein